MPTQPELVRGHVCGIAPAPRSTTPSPSATSTVQQRPPTRSLASKTTTSQPRLSSSRAADSPASPAPITTALGIVSQANSAACCERFGRRRRGIPFSLSPTASALLALRGRMLRAAAGEASTTCSARIVGQLAAIPAVFSNTPPGRFRLPARTPPDVDTVSRSSTMPCSVETLELTLSSPPVLLPPQLPPLPKPFFCPGVWGLHSGSVPHDAPEINYNAVRSVDEEQLSHLPEHPRTRHGRNPDAH